VPDAGGCGCSAAGGDRCVVLSTTLVVLAVAD
jgi:hypothetical protein